MSYKFRWHQLRQCDLCEDVQKPYDDKNKFRWIGRKHMCPNCLKRLGILLEIE